MSTFLSETLGVADSGASWDVGDIKLWQSTRPDIVLFTTKQPSLMKGPNGRYELAVATYTQQQADKSYAISSGSAIFTITTAPLYDTKRFQEAQDAWRATMGPGYEQVKFAPLNTQKASATVLIDPNMGTPDQAHNDKDIGTPGGTNSFLIELTKLGAQAWAQGIKQNSAIPAGVKLEYEYLRMMPDVGATVTVHGQQAFEHFSTEFKVNAQYGFIGGSANIDAAWEKMQRDGTVDITFIGGGLSPELEKLRVELTTTFTQQAREFLFKQLFVPAPDVPPAQAGDTQGGAVGINFALKWKKKTDSIDISQTIRFQGMTWLKASMDTSLAHLFADIDESYLTEVQTQLSFPVSLVVDGNSLLSNVAVATTFSEGHGPETSVFGNDGGNGQFVVASQHPEDVTITYNAKINYASPRWPIIETQGQATVAHGGSQVIIKPSAWIGTHEIHMLVRDGNKILPPSKLTDDDYLTLNVSYVAPYLQDTIKDSIQLTGKEIVEFSYPLSPAGIRGDAHISALGVIQGNFVRVKDQIINPNDTTVFILVTTDGHIQLVSPDSILAEDDKLAETLREGAGRPVVTDNTNWNSNPTSSDGNDTTGVTMNTLQIIGTTIAIEYNADGPTLWIETAPGQRSSVRLRDLDASRPFADTRKQVTVTLDATKTYADRILVELEPSGGSYEQAPMSTDTPPPPPTKVEFDASQAIMLRNGANAWNAWRTQNPNVVIDLENANFDGVQLDGANLINANLSNAEFGIDAIGHHASLQGAVVDGANLTNAKFSNAYLTNLSACGEATTFAIADLTGADLRSAQFTGARLTLTTLIKADLTHANLIGASLFGSDFTGAKLVGADLTDADFAGAKLVGADLTDANLTGAKFTQADLTNAILTGARLAQTDFTNAILKDTVMPADMLVSK